MLITRRAVVGRQVMGRRRCQLTSGFVQRKKANERVCFFVVQRRLRQVALTGGRGASLIGVLWRSRPAEGGVTTLGSRFPVARSK